MATTHHHERTSNAEPMTFEVYRAKNIANERGRLALEADSLTKTELQERAEEIGVDTAGAGTKAELVDRAKSARG